MKSKTLPRILNVVTNYVCAFLIEINVFMSTFLIINSQSVLVN